MAAPFEMKDRLDALRQHSKNQSYHGDYVPDDTGLEAAEGVEEMESLFVTVDEIAQAVDQIAVKVERINHNHSVVLASVKNAEAMDENNQLMEEVKKLSIRVHSGLKRLKEEIHVDEQGPSRNTADFRIKKAQYATLSRKFRDVMGDYSAMQDEYREKNKERIKRQLDYTGRHVTEDQVEEMIESDNPNIFAQDILVDTAQKRQALSEVEARHQEILHLEENIRELHEMFYDLALLVEEQGELIDRIEHNVENAAIHVDKGRKEIRTAVQFKKKNRKLKICICATVTIIIIIILVIAVVIGIIVWQTTQN